MDGLMFWRQAGTKHDGDDITERFDWYFWETLCKKIFLRKNSRGNRLQRFHIAPLVIDELKLEFSMIQELFAINTRTFSEKFTMTNSMHAAAKTTLLYIFIHLAHSLFPLSSTTVIRLVGCIFLTQPSAH